MATMYVQAWEGRKWLESDSLMGSRFRGPGRWVPDADRPIHAMTPGVTHTLCGTAVRYPTDRPWPPGNMVRHCAECDRLAAEGDRETR